jgi:hypothetical protein
MHMLFLINRQAAARDIMPIGLLSCAGLRVQDTNERSAGIKPHDIVRTCVQIYLAKHDEVSE